ncbi:MAG TPA: hypothetical protein VFF17_13715 [Thermoanaerobaculia bacterium]|nr:hypothetical protein [Thermoanaerobaculia bacterium]
MNPAIGRAALAGLAWLALFSILYTLGDEIGAWPKLPTGAFANVDLVAGIGAGVLLLAVLVLPRKATAGRGSGSLG